MDIKIPLDPVHCVIKLFAACAFIFSTSSSLSSPLVVSTSPLVNPNIMKKEIEPAITWLESEGGAVYLANYKFSELFANVKSNKIDFIYAGEGYAYLLNKYFGFEVLLESTSKNHWAIIGKKNSVFADACVPRKSRCYYVENNLFAMFYFNDMSKYSNNAFDVRNSDKADRVVINVLREENSFAFISLGILNLLDDKVRNNLKVFEEKNEGKTYLMMSPVLLKKKDRFQKSMYQFHSEFKDTEGKYHYINTVRFGLPEHDAVNIKPDFAEFLSGLKFN